MNESDNTQSVDKTMYSSKTPGYILEIQTIQVGPFKAMIEALKEIIKEGTFECHPVTYLPDGSINPKSGITLEAMNKSVTLFIKLKLPAEKFNHYYVGSTKPIMINVNMQSLYKLFKTINNDDQMITLFLEERNTSELGIAFDNSQKNKRTTYKLNMLELSSDAEKPSLADPSYTIEICINSVDFHQIIRNLSNVSEHVDITFIDEPGHRNTLVFYGKGEFASQRTELKASPQSSEQGQVEGQEGEENNNSIMITGRYYLKYLSQFAKWAPLCHTVKMYMREHNYPTIFIYQIANVGTASIVISSKVEDDTNKSDEEEDDQEVDLGE
jgi:proliferating cell nuclear antigen PCNA